MFCFVFHSSFSSFSHRCNSFFFSCSFWIQIAFRLRRMYWSSRYFMWLLCVCVSVVYNLSYIHLNYYHSLYLWNISIRTFLMFTIPPCVCTSSTHLRIQKQLNELQANYLHMHTNEENNNHKMDKIIIIIFLWLLL